MFPRTPPQLLVSGRDSDKKNCDMNGTYIRVGSHHGRPWYQKIKSSWAIFWCTRQHQGHTESEWMFLEQGVEDTDSRNAFAEENVAHPGLVKRWEVYNGETFEIDAAVCVSPKLPSVVARDLRTPRKRKLGELMDELPDELMIELIPRGGKRLKVSKSHAMLNGGALKGLIAHQKEISVDMSHRAAIALRQWLMECPDDMATIDLDTTVDLYEFARMYQLQRLPDALIKIFNFHLKAKDTIPKLLSIAIHNKMPRLFEMALDAAGCEETLRPKIVENVLEPSDSIRRIGPKPADEERHSDAGL